MTKKKYKNEKYIKTKQNKKIKNNKKNKKRPKTTFLYPKLIKILKQFPGNGAKF